jgi:zinc D-Ala-D-Ala carboxypeptidase
VIGVLTASVLGAAVALVVLGATGRVVLAHERVAGRPVAILEEVPGPESGPVCPLDGRYVDEPPDRLRPDVLDAWLRLEAAAGEHGVLLCLHDGKRSVGQQQRQFADAVRQFGDAEQASRYVLPPEESMHVAGIAVDVQPLASAAWVERNGRPWGWCRRYENEAWHFEYDPAYVASGCPPLLPSATGS